MNDFIIPAVIFAGIYYIFKNFTDFLLKRKIIKAGHFDRAAILDQNVSSEISGNEEVNKYPSLKWGLVAFFAGIGFIIINQLGPSPYNSDNYHQFMNDSVLPFGIELVCISMGFIVYFIIVNIMKKK
jgi:hypothetical protein